MSEKPFHLLLTFVLALLPTVLAAGELTGRVTDAETGLPIEGATVLIPALRLGASTTASGRYRIDSLPAGTHRLHVSCVGYREVEQVVEVEEEPAALDVRLEPEPIQQAPVEVVGEADAFLLHRRPAFATVLTRESFEGRATSVAEVLSSSVGVKVRRLGGLGSYSTVSVRGSTSEQVDVYLDGIPLNAAMGGGVDLSTLPLSQVYQIEVHRGASSDGPAMGGSVYLRTPDTAGSFGQGASLSWGSFDTRGANAMVRALRGKDHFVVLADYSASDSNFRFLDDNGTEYNTNDDEAAVRRNGDFLSGSLLGKWERRLRPSVRTFVHGNLYWSRKGIPGISNNQSLAARLKAFRGLTEAGFQMSGLLDRFALESRLVFSRKNERYIDRLGEVGVGRQDQTYGTTMAGWRARLATVVGRRVGLELAPGIRWERFDPESHMEGPADLLASRRWISDVKVSADASLPSGRGVLTAWAGVERLASHTSEENAFGPPSPSAESRQVETLAGFGAGVRVDVVPGLWVKANAGRSHRAPSFYELFGDRGGVIGNTDLVPERGWSWDAGVRFQPEEGPTLEAAYYDHHYNDLIQFVQISQGTSRPFNIGRASVRGAEASAALKPVEGVHLSANYTLQLSRNRSETPHWNGRRLPGRSVHELDARIEVGGRRAAVFGDVSFEAGTYLDRANLRPVGSRKVYGAGIRVSPVEELPVTVEAKNLLGNRVSDVWGYPLPGRAYFVTIRESF